MPEWIYVIRPTRKPLITTLTEEEAQAMSDHFQHLKGLLDRGKLVIAGPALDESLGIVVFEAEDEHEARAIMDADPAVEKGLMSATLHPYRTSLLRGRP